jgi:hypothetical protein
MDLLRALTSHYKPRVQQGLLCGNFKFTQEVLGYLSKMQGLNENRDNFKAPKRDYPSGDANRRPQHGPRQDDRKRDEGNNVNVRFVRRNSDRRNSGFTNRRNRNLGETEFYGRRQGRVEGDSADQLNPNAQRFNPLNSELNPICHLLVLLGGLTFMGPCILSIFQYISNKLQRYKVYLYLKTALHVSCGTSTHHQERIYLYLQHLVFVTPLLLPAAIVEEWRTPPTAHSNRFQLFHDSGR